jgi:ABC-type proline/glycine betaine transport system permease subunit
VIAAALGVAVLALVAHVLLGMVRKLLSPRGVRHSGNEGASSR